MQPQPEHVSLEAAYAAALNRAVRTTEALVLAEAQVIELRRQLAASQAETKHQRERYTVARDRATRLHRRLEQRDREEDQEEGEGDGSEAYTDTEAVCEAVPAHDFSD